MTATFDDAVALAAEKFRGVCDKSGEPYILHCMSVTLAQSNNAARQVAILHDVVEDTDVTLAELAKRGFSQDVIDGVDAMTHRADESYQAYVLRIDRIRKAGQLSRPQFAVRPSLRCARNRDKHDRKRATA